LFLTNDKIDNKSTVSDIYLMWRLRHARDDHANSNNWKPIESQNHQVGPFYKTHS